MSPNEMVKYREKFDRAARLLGWEKKEITVEHERDWDCSWEETIWMSGNERLFSESDLEEGLVKEIIRIANDCS